MTTYDPAMAPEPTNWLELDEQERIALTEKYHREAHIELPNVTLHSAFHVIVENQLAEEVDSTVATVARLTGEGVSRHDAIHAVASVLAEQVALAAKSKSPNYGTSAQARIDSALARLKAKDWKG